MADPKGTIDAAAAAIGLTSTVEVGDDMELNLILDDKTDFPLVALMRVGEDLERRHLRPGESISWRTKWVCAVYVLDKANLDDTGAARHTALNTIHDTARDLLSEIIKSGSTALQTAQAETISITRLPVNEFDLNTNGVVFQIAIPDTNEYC